MKNIDRTTHHLVSAYA